MSRINIKKHRYSNFAKLAEYARSVEPHVLSAGETTFLDEAAMDIARAGGCSFVEAKRALEDAINCVQPI